MISEAVLGLAAGTLLTGAWVGFRQVRNWVQLTRILALAGLVLVVAGILAALIFDSGSGATRLLVAPLIALGGLVYLLRIEPSPGLLLLSGGLLVYASVAQPGNAIVSATTALVVVVSSLALPTLNAAWHEWRRQPERIDGTRLIWLGVSAAFAVSVILNLLERGAWFGTTPGAAWLLAAWLAASGSLLTHRGRPRAALLAAAAITLAFSALSG